MTSRSIFGVAMAGLALSLNLLTAQTIDKSRDIFDLKDIDKGVTTSMPSVGPALEGTVDPNEYFVGPSDIFSVNIWTSPPLSFLLTVTPEGTLIVPTVGEVRVSDLSLADAKQRVVGEIKKRYLTGSPTVTLVNPRYVSVTVTGAVRYPGKYILRATDRVDKAIEEANKRPANMTQEERKSDLESARAEQKPSRRHIRLIRKDGTALRVDIPKYYATRNSHWDAFLREGDVVFVPLTENMTDAIGVYGAVQKPDRFEFAHGDNIYDAIRLAYGLSPRAFADSVFVYRYGVDAKSIRVIHIDLRDTLGASSFFLQSGDRVVVKENPELRGDYRVAVEGEVVQPGTYPITRNQTRLSTVIAQAGGFTEFASLRSAEVIRRSDAGNGGLLQRLYSNRGSFFPDDSAYYRLESELRIKQEIVAVDLERLVLKGDSSQDIILSPEDSVFIPSLHRTVYVFGQVTSPGNIPYVPGKDARYYIEKAGGFTDFAKTGDVAIVKRATKQWMSPKETIIEEGDYVWVPMDPPRSTSYYLTMVSQAGSILAGLLTVVVLILQLKK